MNVVPMQHSSQKALKPFHRLWVCLVTLALTLSPIPSLSQSSTQELPPAGQVISTVGEVIARDANGDDRSLRRKSPILEGDTLFTGPNSSAQIRMSDAALISLKEDTAFTIITYQYEEEIETDSVVLELV